MARSLREKALFLLSRREYAPKELFARLMRYEEAEESSVLKLIEELVQLNYLNELRYAQSRVREQQARFGNRKIVAMLKEKGVKDSIIEQAFLEIEEESKRCFAVWQKKFTAPNNAQEFAKQGRFLCSRGFAPNMVTKLLKTLQNYC